MGGMSRGKHEDSCGISCTAEKVVKKIKEVFTAKPEPYNEHKEKEPTTGQARRLGKVSGVAIEEQLK